MVAQTLGNLAFAFFASMMLLQFLFAWKIMPETRGLSLEELQRLLGISGGTSAVAANEWTPVGVGAADRTTAEPAPPPR